MIRSFARGVLIGTACICLLALGWLFLFRPSLAQYEASELKEAFTESDPGGNSGVLSLPWFNAENEKQLDLASLQAQYPDVQAWLSIPGTRVDYPVLQSSMENPEYYLRRNYKGEWRTAGSLFLQSDCRLSGKTLIVYAHNMNDGSMFADIAGYTHETYWREHPIIQCDSLTRQREYEVMAVLQFKDSEQAAQDYYSVPRDEMNFTEYISRLADAALYDTGIQAVWGDQILALSTCSRQDSDSRILVIARKTGL